MIKNKNRKGFSLLELIVSITAISIISTIIYKTYVSMQEIDRKTTMVREMDSIKKSMIERLKSIDILEGTLISSDKIYYGNEEAFDKDIFTRLDDTPVKKNFWGLQENQYKKYIYAQSKYFSNSNGKIPYTDFWVVMVGPKLDRIYNNPTDMLGELFLFEADNGLITKFNENYDDPLNYAIAKSKGLNKATLREEFKTVIVFKVSTQEIVLNKYNETINQINNYAKNLKDWGSIQMSMYENIIAKYGGSYNIDYFVSLGFQATEVKGSLAHDFKKEMVYSSLALDNTDNPIRTSSGTDQGFNDILSTNLNSTNYGIVICENECIGTISDAEIISMQNKEISLDNSTDPALIGEAELMITGSVSLDSQDLLPGSKAIFGIGNTGATFGNSFGEKYKFYFTNVKEWEISWTDVGDNNTGNLTYTQNVPVNNAYAPYSATLFTFFPWFLHDSIEKPSLSNGYYEVRVFPELR